MSFQYDLLIHLKSYILIQNPITIYHWFQRYEKYFEFLKHWNLSPLFAYNSKSILATTDSFLLIMLHLSYADMVTCSSCVLTERLSNKVFMITSVSSDIQNAVFVVQRRLIWMNLYMCNSMYREVYNFQDGAKV